MPLDRLPLRTFLTACAVAFCAAPPQPAENAANLVEDASFEAPSGNPSQPFLKWETTRIEGDCTSEVGLVPHKGKSSALLFCPAAGKIRISQARRLEAGRYRFTAYLRGLDLSSGSYDQDTEFMFNERYLSLHKRGSFGWVQLTYVADLPQASDAGPSFGLWAPGFLWIDDVTMERVDSTVPLTAAPVLGREEAPIAPPGPLGAESINCPRCRRRNMPGWERCYACGTSLRQAGTSAAVPPVHVIASFEDSNPFQGGAVVGEHATDGAKALRIDVAPAIMLARQDWSAYDYLAADIYTDARQPVPLTVEIRDTATQDYWTRVNYRTVVPPGASNLIVPLKQLYVGEKARPGRKLILDGITALLLVPAAPGRPLFIDRLRLERDAHRDAFFEGLHAFDFGTGGSPVMDGFTSVTPATVYTPGSGYGLKNAKIARAVDVLEPDPLYQDFLAIESGGFAVEVPNGRYRVFVNIDSPPGFWGEIPVYHGRAILAQGKEVAADTSDFRSFQQRYFQFWDKDDLPSENTFDKYDPARFHPKVFDVDVKNGVLEIDFRGEGWACAVSAIIVFPVEKAALGERFLEYVKEKRRFYFDIAFKRILHSPEGDPLEPSEEDNRRGYVLFQRDFMKDLYYNDTPFRSEVGKPLEAEAFAGEDAVVPLGVLPLRDLGAASVAVSDFSGPGLVPESAVDVGYVSYRLMRVTSDGAVYTIAPRLVIPKRSVVLPKGVARSFWLTIHTPAGAGPGLYTGTVTLTPQQGLPATLPLRLKVRKGVLDAVDIPAGPFGGQIRSRWIAADPETSAFTNGMTLKSLRALRQRGFTMFTGVPSVSYKGFQNGKPVLDFEQADAEMKQAKGLGFLAVCSYGAGLDGLGAYGIDAGKMKGAGFTSYSEFVKAIYSAVERHAEENHWIPVYWNLADEPVGAALTGSIANARAYRAAFPTGPPLFTVATSLEGHDPAEPHFQLALAAHIPALNDHDEAGIKALLNSGGEWGYYNSGSRWTYGEYLYKAVTEFQLRFRLAWHWNAVTGDPYYALDGREDDNAWANASPNGALVPSLAFFRIAAGLDDYRSLRTLARLAKEKAGTPQAEAAARLIEARMARFHLGDLDHDRILGAGDWVAFRREVADAIEALR